MGGEEIRVLMSYIDSSLDQRFKPVHETMAGLAKNVEKIFNRLDAISPQIISAEKDISYIHDRIEENEAAFDRCRDDCKTKMQEAKEETGTQTKLKIMLWILSGAVVVLLGAVSYFLGGVLDKIK